MPERASQIAEEDITDQLDELMVDDLPEDEEEVTQVRKIKIEKEPDQEEKEKITMQFSSVESDSHSNQDNFISNPDMGIIGVLDGMGGEGSEGSGAIASNMAKESIYAGLSRIDRSADVGIIEGQVEEIINRAQQKILDSAAKNELFKGMKTTCTFGIFNEDKSKLVVGHLGDSHAFRIRDGKIEQLTRDHSLLGDFIDQGFISKDEASDHGTKISEETTPKLHEFFLKNPNVKKAIEGKIGKPVEKVGDFGIVLSEALGKEGKISPNVESHDVVPGDEYIFATDGIDTLSLNEMMDLYEKGGTEAVVAESKRRAREEGAKDDDMTVASAEVSEIELSMEDLEPEEIEQVIDFADYTLKKELGDKVEGEPNTENIKPRDKKVIGKTVSVTLKNLKKRFGNIFKSKDRAA